jgi:hypothetical protein
MESNVEIPGLQVCGVGGGRTGIDFEIFRLVLGDQIQNSAPYVGQEPVVMFLYRVCEHVILQQKVAKVHVESGELVFAHGVDLFHVYQFSVKGLRQIAVGARSCS